MSIARVRSKLLASALLAVAACSGEPPTAAVPAPLRSPDEAADAARVDADIDRVLGDPAPYAAAFSAVQRAVQARDAQALAAMVEYPLTTTLDGKPATIADASAFMREYARIVTPPIAAAITAQHYGKLMVSDQGVMFGDGELWLNGICRDPECKAVDVRIVRIQPGPG